MKATTTVAAAARGITLVQAEHLKFIASPTARVEIAPAMLRRNFVVSGITLVALTRAD